MTPAESYISSACQKRKGKLVNRKYEDIQNKERMNHWNEMKRPTNTDKH